MAQTTRLYDYILDADCYKARLFMQFLDRQPEVVELDVYPGGELDSSSFRRLSPLGILPVLEEDDFVVCGAQAVLLYLATKYDMTHKWLPGDPESVGTIGMWLSFGARLADCAGAARRCETFRVEADVAEVRRAAHQLLRVLDEHLWFGEQRGQKWICGGGFPSIADIACFPDVALAEEGDIELLYYPAVRRWLERFRGLPGFIGMPGVFAPPVG
jgi:glutathione S-transferase